MKVVNLRDFYREGRLVLPENTVRVDRASRFGNPFRIGDPDPNGNPLDRQQAISLYRAYLGGRLLREPTFLEPLRGKDLACWCAPLACHADVLIVSANR